MPFSQAISLFLVEIITIKIMLICPLLLLVYGHPNPNPLLVNEGETSMCSTEQCALLKFKESITVDPLDALSTWNSNNSVNICRWNGVLCDPNGQHVVALKLPSLQLQGAISPHLGLLPRLSHLNLSRNNLSGAIPPHLSNCSSLSRLDLSFNLLSGDIPPHLGYLSQLQVLFLSMNQLTGSIPPTLGNCTQLLNLQIGANMLTGSIPTELGNMKVLDELLVSDNQLTGSIPASVGNCSSLTILQLNKNQLTGTIPPQLGNLKRLDFLTVWSNNLEGPIPATLGNCRLLKTMDLSMNQLTGKIPAELARIESLQSINLFANELTGRFPAEFGGMPNLRRLGIHSNYLEGEFPMRIFNISTMLGVSLDSNLFTGIIPEHISNCHGLTVLYLSNNLFSGSIPLSMGDLPFLNILHLEGNVLTGTIPPTFAKLSVLVELDLSSNNLTGSIGKLGGLSMASLNLSHNRLTGFLPKDLESHLQLQVVDLSFNNLTGSVSLDLHRFASLVVLNLSHNFFTGLVPDRAPFNNASIASLSANPDLCGNPIRKPCPLPPPPQQSHQSLRTLKLYAMAIAIPIALFLFLLIVGMVAWRARQRRHQASPHHIQQQNQSLHNALGQSKWLRLTRYELERATNGFHSTRILGTGSVSTVYRGDGIDKVAGNEVAIKLLRNEAMGSKSESQFTEEVCNMGKLRHRNLVRVLGYTFSMDTKAIIMELLCRGSLDGAIHGTNENEAAGMLLTWQRRVKIIRGVAQGLSYLHHDCPHGVFVHCDLKPANILLDDDFEPRICDFGIAKLLHINQSSEPASLSAVLRGSIGYIPPEYGYNSMVTTSGDVYSFGIVMMEVLTGKRPTSFGEEAPSKTPGLNDMVSWVQANYRHHLKTLLGCQFDNESVNEEQATGIADISLLCTNFDPRKRPNMIEVSKMLDNLYYHNKHNT